MAKCPICGKNKTNKKDLLEHVENSHKNEIPQSMSTAQYIYSLNHNGRDHGVCRICGKPTPWNEKTGKPKQICGEKSCKDKVSREFEQNLKLKLNMTRQDLMNDPEHQEQMLANRKISGIYKWSDNKHKFTYTGTYEKFALEWLDKVMDIDPETIQTPGPKVQYKFEGKMHYWITDMYLTEYNLVVEIKDGNATGEKNTHPGFAHNRALEKAKDDYMRSQNQYNYIKLTNKNMMQLVKILSEIRLINIFSEEKGINKSEPIININEAALNEAVRKNDKGDIIPKKCPKCNSPIKVYFKGEPVYQCTNCGKVFGVVAFNESVSTWDVSKEISDHVNGRVSNIGEPGCFRIHTDEPITIEQFKEIGYTDFQNMCRSSKPTQFKCKKYTDDGKCIEVEYNANRNWENTIIKITDIDLNESVMSDMDYMGCAEEIAQHVNGKLIKNVNDPDEYIVQTNDNVTVLDEELSIEYDTNLNDIDFLNESVMMEKLTGQLKELHLKIVSYIKDIERKWQGIQSINVSKDEKNVVSKILELSKKLINHITEILKTGKAVAYEALYENFLSEVKSFKKCRKDKNKDESMPISELQRHTIDLEKSFKRSSKLKSDDKFVNKYKTALHIIITRTLYVINLLLYNTSGKGVAGSYNKDKKAGIVSKRYGGTNVKVNINKLEDNESATILARMRKSTNYSSYKKIFDEVTEKYNRTGVSAIKFLDLEKHNKLVFITYGKLKPMIFKKGTKLYHISGCETIKALNPVYKCRDNITFYSTPRVYFTDKLVDPKKVLPNLEKVAVYEYECTEDTTAYRDNEYGSWYHHCIYVESTSPLKVKNITKEVLGDDADNENKEPETQNESINDINIKNDKSGAETLREVEKVLASNYNEYKRMDVSDKKKNLSKIISVVQKSLSIVKYITGVQLISDGRKELSDNKRFMKDLKTEMPMNHETYNKINNGLRIKSILKIVLGILLSVANIIMIYKISSKTVGKAVVSMISSINKISNKNDVNTFSTCRSISNTLLKILNLNSINENCELYDIIDIDYQPVISNDDMNSLCEGSYSYIPQVTKGVLNESSFPFFLSNRDINNYSNSSYKKHDAKLPNANFSTYDVKEDTWKNILFPKTNFIKKISSIFHKVEINESNHTIEIRGINYLKLIKHIKELYPDQKVYKIFEIIYNPKDWEKYQNKLINKSYVRIEHIETYEFFALELSILFKELFEKYGLEYYNEICTEIYNKTWLSKSDIIKPEYLDLNALRKLNSDYELKLYQKEFIESYPILKARLNLNGYILSFDQGLGKTLTSVALALCLNKEKMYIVCPNALKENWAIEIKSYLPRYSNENIWKEEVYIHGVSKEYDKKKVKFVIVNQESIAKIFDKVDKNSKNILVIDESHNFRNINSKRSGELIKLRDMLNTKDVLVMSGTPIKASPNEICPALRLIDPLFTDEVAGVYNKCFNMNDIVASNLIQTRFGKVMYRKTKAEVLELPKKTIDTLKLKVSNSDRYYISNIKQLVKARAKELYKEEYKEYDSMKEEFHILIHKYSTSSVEDMKTYLKIVDDNIPNYELHEMDVLLKQTYLEKYVYPSITGSDKERLDYLITRFVYMWQHCIGVALGEIMHPRRKELFIKLYDDNKAIINNMIFDNLKKTVIFTPIVEVAKHIHESLGEAGLSSVLVTGQIKDKLTPILRFKEDSNVDVLVATTQTLGTGVTLTEANLMLFFGTPWRSTDFDQCCDRIYRIGQTTDVHIFKVLMESDQLNLSTRMEDILDWSNKMFGAMITDEKITVESLMEAIEFHSRPYSKGKKPKKSSSQKPFYQSEINKLCNKSAVDVRRYFENIDDGEFQNYLNALNSGDNGTRKYANLTKEMYDIYKERKMKSHNIEHHSRNKVDSVDESVMSIGNLSPIMTTGLFEELEPNNTNDDLEKELDSLKKVLHESNNDITKIDPDRYCPETIDFNNIPEDRFILNRVKADIVNNSIVEENPVSHHGNLYASSDFHIFGVVDKEDNNNNPTNIQQVNKIIDDINSKAKEDDTLIICGDLGYKLDDCLYQHTKYFLSAIRCKHIWLTVGNHDLLSNDEYKSLGCELVCDRLNYNGVVFTHYPTNATFNFHGHLHDEPMTGKHGYDKISPDNKTNCFYHTHGIIDVSKILGDFIDEHPESLEESSIENSDFMFGNGEYSAITDNRFTEFQTGEPSDQNEDIDPYTAMFSPNNSKPVQDYMDASNNFETNEDVRINMEMDPSICGPNDLSSLAQSIYNSNFQ